MSSCETRFLSLGPLPRRCPPALIFIEPVLLPDTERCFRLPDSFSSGASVPHPGRSPCTLYYTYLVNAKHRGEKQLLIAPFVAARWTRWDDTELLMRPPLPGMSTASTAPPAPREYRRPIPSRSRRPYRWPDDYASRFSTNQTSSYFPARFLSPIEAR